MRIWASTLTFWPANRTPPPISTPVPFSAWPPSLRSPTPTFPARRGAELLGVVRSVGAAGLVRSPTRTRSASKALRAVLVKRAHGAARTHGCQFRGYHRALMVRRGYKRAIVATAHKRLRVLYVVLRDARPYHDPEADYEELMVRRNARAGTACFIAMG